VRIRSPLVRVLPRSGLSSATLVPEVLDRSLGVARELPQVIAKLPAATHSAL